MELLEESRAVLEQFAAGDESAFQQLFRVFQGEVYAWIARIVRDPATAEDLTIETFWRIHRAHARFDPQRSFAAWARRIATNVALDQLKRPQVRTEQALDSEDPRTAANLAAPTLGDPGVRQEIRDRTRRAFQQLPARLRIVAALALVEEQSHGEIAEALNISTAAVKSRVFRAVKLLRRKLRDLGGDYE